MAYRHTLLIGVHSEFEFQVQLLTIKATQYKKLASNALRFTFQNLKSCKPHEKQNKKHQNDRFIDEKLKIKS